MATTACMLYDVPYIHIYVHIFDVHRVPDTYICNKYLSAPSTKLQHLSTKITEE